MIIIQSTQQISSKQNWIPWVRMRGLQELFEVLAGEIPASVSSGSHIVANMELWVGWMSDLELRGILIPVILMNKAMTIKFCKTLFTASTIIIIGLALMPGLVSPDQGPPELWLQDQENDASPMDATVLSEQEIEEELARIQAAFEEEEVLEEFIPSEPLSADIAVSFPSDI